MSSGSGGAAGPQFAAIRNDLRGIGLEFAGIHQAVQQIKGTVNVFRLLEQQLVLTNSVAGGTVEQFLQMEKVARSFALASTFSAAEAANSFYFLASAGFSVEESLASANGVLLLAQATLSNIGETSDIVASNIRAFGLEAQDASRISNTLAATITKSQATIQKLGFAFRQVGPIASQAGLTFEQTSAALGTLFDIGLRGEQAGTALRNVIVRLQAPTGQAAELIEALGIEVTDATGKFNGLFDILEQLGSKNISDQDLSLLFGTEALSGANALIAATEELAAGGNKLNNLTDAVTGTATAYLLAQKQLSTLDGTIKIATSSFNDLRIGMGGLLAPVVTEALELFIDISQAFQGSSDSSKIMTAQVALAVGGLVLMTKTLTSMVPWLTNVSAGFASVSAGATSVSLATNNTRNLGRSALVASRGIGTLAAGMGTLASSMLGPVGVVVALGLVGKALLDLRRSSQDAQLENIIGDLGFDEVNADDVSRRFKQLAQQTTIDEETGVGATNSIRLYQEEIKLQKAALQDTKAELEDLRVSADSAVTAAEAYTETLTNELLNAFEQFNVGSDNGFTNLQRDEGVNAALDQFLLEFGNSSVDSMEGTINRNLAITLQAIENSTVPDGYKKQMQEAIQASLTGLLDITDENLLNDLRRQARTAEGGKGFQEIIKSITTLDNGEELFKRNAEDVNQRISDVTAVIEREEARVKTMTNLFVQEVRTYIEANAQNSDAVLESYDVIVRLNANYEDELSKRLLTEDVTAASEAGRVFDILLNNSSFGITADDLPDIEEKAKFNTPLIDGFLSTFDKALRKQQLELVQAMADVSTNPDDILAADIAILRQALVNDKENFSADVVKAFEASRLLDGNTDISKTIVDAFKTGTIATQSGNVELANGATAFKQAILDQLSAAMFADGGTGGEGNIAAASQLIDRYTDGLNVIGARFTQEVNETQLVAARKAKQATFALRFPFETQLALNLEKLQAEGADALANAVGTLGVGADQTAAISEAEFALRSRNEALRTQYEGLFVTHVVQGTDESINEALRAAFSGRDLDGLSLGDLVDNKDIYISKALALLTATLPDDTPDYQQRIEQARQLLDNLATQAQAEGQKTNNVIMALSQERRKAISDFEAEIRLNTDEAVASKAALQASIAELTGQGNLTDLIINERQTSIIADTSNEITSITAAYDELLLRASGDVDTTALLIEQKEYLLELTLQQEEAELRYYDSAEGRSAASLQAQQAQVDLFISQNRNTGTIVDGMAAAARQLSIDLPTRFTLGMQLMQTGVTEFSSIMSNTLLGMEDDFAGAMAGMLRGFAQMILQNIIQALVLKAIMSFIPGLNVVSGISGAGAQAASGVAQATGILGSLGATGSPTPSAKGNMFDPNGQIIKDYTEFNMGYGGRGSAAEVAQEAIMPMGRDSQGRLGVILADDHRTATNQGMVVNHGAIVVNVESSGGNEEQDNEQGKVIAKQVSEMMKAREQASMQKSAKRGDAATSRIRN